MQPTDATFPPPSAALRLCGACAILIALVVVGHYVLSAGFGLYEDDIFGIAPSLTGGLDEALFRFKREFFNPRFGGRIFVTFMPHLFSAIGIELAGLHGAYMVAAASFSLTVLLLFSLVGRVYGPRIGFAAALVFLFFPADVNKIYLQHSFIHWPALCICLSAMHLYVSGRRIPAYLLSILCLFYYESAFLPFFGAPLLRPAQRPFSHKEIALHTLLCLGILGSIFLLRSTAGDFRVGGDHAMIATQGAGLVRTGLKSTANMVLGPLTCLASYPYAILRFIHHITPGTATAALIGSLLSGLGFALLPAGAGERFKTTVRFGSKALRIEGTLESTVVDTGLLRAFVVGLILMSVSYLLSFTSFPALHLFGRVTREHFAAGFGMALAGGATLVFVGNLASRLASQRVGVLVCALCVGPLTGYAFHVQQEYVHNWDDQRWMWQQIVELAPDATEDTRIFVIDRDLPQESRPIASIRGWHTPAVNRYLFDYPTQWKTPPRTFVMPPDWAGAVEMKAGVPQWFMPTGLWWSHWEPLPVANLIVLEMDQGKLHRRTGGYPVLGAMFPLKPVQENPPRFPTRPLYEYLVR